MNDCVNAEVRDALPDFVNNRLEGLDAATIKEHIDSCADCQAEAAILRDVRASQMVAPKMDASRIAAAIPAYAVAQPRRSTSLRPWLMAAAAAIVAVGGYATLNRSATSDTTPAVAVVTPAAPVATQAESKSAAPAAAVSPNAVAKANRKEVEVASLSLVGSTDDLSDADLESLVAALDGIESVPSAEPGSVTTTVDHIDGNDDQ